MFAVAIALIILSFAVFSFNNVCVLKIILSKRLRRKVSHIAICSLLFSHDLQGLIVIPAFALKRLERQDHGIYCDIFRFSYMLTNYGACISLLLITMDRVFAVFYPLKHRVKWTIKKNAIFYMSRLVVCSMFMSCSFFYNKKQRPLLIQATKKLDNIHAECQHTGTLFDNEYQLCHDICEDKTILQETAKL